MARTPDICPNCGAEVPPRCKACPECGADDQTGWSEDTNHGGLNFPDEEFDYENFVKGEFGVRRVKPRGLHWFWWLVALLLLVGVVLVCIP